MYKWGLCYLLKITINITFWLLKHSMHTISAIYSLYFRGYFGIFRKCKFEILGNYTWTGISYISGRGAGEATWMVCDCSLLFNPYFTAGYLKFALRV